MFLHLFIAITFIGNLIGTPILARNTSDCTLAEDGIIHYRGKHSFTKFHHECLSWHDLQTTYSDVIIESNFFDDISVVAAENYCRNPDMDTDGPWCYIQDEDDAIKEHCDVCKSLVPKPTSSPAWPDTEPDENIHKDFFQNLSDDMKRAAAYIRKKFREIFERIQRKVKQIASSIADYFN